MGFCLAWTCVGLVHVISDTMNLCTQLVCPGKTFIDNEISMDTENMDIYAMEYSLFNY